MTTSQEIIPAPAPSGSSVAGAREAFQNHEDRIGELERMFDGVRKAFPYLESTFGKPRFPHEVWYDDGSATGTTTAPSDAFSQAVDTINAKQANLEALMSAILDKLSSGQVTAGAVPLNPDDAGTPPAPPIPSSQPEA